MPLNWFEAGLTSDDDMLSNKTMNTFFQTTHQINKYVYVLGFFGGVFEGEG
jgi:hypothetical protein